MGTNRVAAIVGGGLAFAIVSMFKTFAPRGRQLSGFLCAVLIGIVALSDPAATSAQPTVATLAADNVTSSSARLRGQSNPNGNDTSVLFQFGTTTNYGSVTTSIHIGTNLTVFSATVNLMASTTYHFRACASSSAGTNYGNDMTFTTSPAPPPSVTTLAADNFVGSSVRLNGSASGNGASAIVYFEYGTTVSYGNFSLTNTIPASGIATFSATLNGLEAGTYHFRAVAQNSIGTSTGSDLTFVITGAPPTVVTLAATAVTHFRATLNGEVNPGGLSSIAFFQYSTNLAFDQSVAPIDIGSGGSTVTFSATIGGLTPGTTYHYRAVGSNSSGIFFGMDVPFTTTGAVELVSSTVDPSLLTPGHRVQLRQAAPGFGVVSNITRAENLLALAPSNAGVAFDAYDIGVTNINYADSASGLPGGHFLNDRDVHLIPGNLMTTGDQDNYVIDASGYIQFLAEGFWVLNINSDEGFRLRMGPANEVIAEFPGRRTPGDTAVVVHAPNVGYYKYQLVYFEESGGSEVEFSAHGPGQPFELLVGDPNGLLRAYHDLELPRLDIQRQGGNVVLSWPLRDGPWTLQNTTNVAPVADWLTTTPAPVVSAGRYVTTNSASAPSQFYRLRRP